MSILTGIISLSRVILGPSEHLVPWPHYVAVLADFTLQIVFRQYLHEGRKRLRQDR